MVDSITASCSGPVAAKQSLNHYPSTAVHHSWYAVFVLICCVQFTPKMELCIMDVSSLVYSLEGIVPQVL